MLPLLLVAKLVFSSRLATLTRNIDTGFLLGHDKMRSGADLRITSPLVSFNHVTDPHFVTFSSSLYTTIRNPNPHLTRILTLTLTVTLQ